jgi:hypothetical protein
MIKVGEPNLKKFNWDVSNLLFSDYFELERCANELAEIAKVHCYRFGNMARSELEAAFQSIQISLSRSFNEDKRLSPKTMQQMYKRVNFLIFEAS